MTSHHTTSPAELPSNHAPDHLHHHAEARLRTLYLIYIALMVLLALTVGASFAHLPGHLNIVVTMVIAVVKATLVLLVFMHVMHSSRLVWLFSMAAFVWFGILLTFTFAVYLSRNDLTRGQPFPAEYPFAHSI